MSFRETPQLPKSPFPVFQQEWNDGKLLQALPVPPADANKYTRGTLIVIAGTPRYPGAACLTAIAGQRMGAGYTEVVTCKAARAALLARAPSLVVVQRKDWQPRSLAGRASRKNAAVCVGPGFVAGEAGDEQLVLEVLTHAEQPALVDGGGLSALCGEIGLRTLSARAARGRVTVITPHGGEAARLAQTLALDVESFDDPAQLACAISATTGTIVVNKGPDTFIAQGTRVTPMREGTPALAKAGTGDILAGMIAGLLAQGVAPYDAAVLGATLHARAGAAAQRAQTIVATCPEDVLDAIPDALFTLLNP